jgi:alpha-galactosidase
MGIATKLKIEDGTLIAERVQDCQDILDRNALLRSMPQKSVGTETWGRHVASIPNVIMERWLNEELERGNTTIKMFGPEMDRLVKRKLQDPDWKWLRVDK